VVKKQVGRGSGRESKVAADSERHPIRCYQGQGRFRKEILGLGDNGHHLGSFPRKPLTGRNNVSERFYSVMGDVREKNLARKEGGRSEENVEGYREGGER